MTKEERENLINAIHDELGPGYGDAVVNRLREEFARLDAIEKQFAAKQEP